MLSGSLVRRIAVAIVTASFLCTTAPSVADTSPGDGRGVFVWFDSAVWSSTTDWFSDPSPVPDCITTLGDGNTYMIPSTTIVADTAGNGFTNLRNLVTDNDPAMPANASLNGGNVFVIATSLDPTGANEFRPWSNLNTSVIPDCFISVDNTKEITFKAFHSFVKGFLNPASGQKAPISLMFSSSRTLRFGRILSSEHHLDPNDSKYFGGRTQMNANSNATNLEFTTSKQESKAHCWSIYWPNNATTSTVDDVDMVLNYTNRCIEFAEYCNQQGDLGTAPTLDVYLDLELMQLNHTAPSNNNASVGTSYPGMENMPETCKESASFETPPTYWAVSANVADAFWRTLRMTRALIDVYNNDPNRQPNDVKLTFSVWSQEAYRFCSPRFGILDTMADVNSWDHDTTSVTWGKFIKPFGTARVLRRVGGTDDSPDYSTESWNCNCARMDPSAGLGDAMYNMTPPTVDDFNINNCILKYAHRMAYGTYQSVPAEIQKPKNHWGHISGRNNVAVDMIGAPMPSKKEDFAVLPGDGVPLGGYNMNVTINFAKEATFVGVPGDEWVAWQARQADGGWALYPPDFDGSGTDHGPWSRYYYNPIGAWPNPSTNDNATPDWSNFGPTTECARYWGSFDMTHGGWVPFAARMLTQVDRWRVHNNVDVADAPKIIMTLELTPLSSAQAGAGGGACLSNSYGNQWLWGDDSATTPCASGMNATGDPNLQWPHVMMAPMCQSDRVLYLYGSDNPDAMNTSSDIKIGSAWGLTPASTLLSTTLAPSGTALSAYLDSTTPYAFNNHLSYHCLLSHQGMSGFYVPIPPDPNKIPYAVDATTGARSCWSPYGVDPQHGKPLFGGCSCPAATQFPQPTARNYLILGTPGDTTGDNRSDIDDILNIISRWGEECDPPCVFDHNGDRIIDVGDLLTVIEAFGTDWN